MAVKDVTDLLERLEAFEDRLGVRLEAMSAQLDVVDDDEVAYVVIQGELHPKSGTELEQSIELIVAVYDSASRVVATGTKHFYSSDFFGFEIFKISVEIYATKLTRIIVQPKRG